MANPFGLVENLFSKVQFPGHTVTSEESPVGFEVDRVADGRRSPYDYWSPSTANVTRNLYVDCDRVRAANAMFLDRGHNLAGKQVLLRTSQDGGTTYETIFDITLPTTSGSGKLTDGLGVRTEEGAWCIRFPFREGKRWNLNIPAMGAGVKPKIVGLWLGMGMDFPPLEDPWSEDANELVVQETQSAMGWLGRTEPVVRRGFQLGIKLNNLIDYDQARYNFEHFARNRPMWIVHDTDVAQRAVLALRAGQIAWQRARNWAYRQALVPWVEHEPLAA